MGLVPDCRDAARRGEFALRQISAGPGAFLGADGAGVVFGSPAGPFHAVRHRLEAALVVAQRVPLALEHSVHRIFVLVADYIYFSALRDPASLVSIVMSLRRGSTLVGFAGGLLLFGEKNGWQKFPAVIGILVGIVLTVMG
jgi:drug/metabolite transporter (DMT)-like permease